jgi:hypothetical protein
MKKFIGILLCLYQETWAAIPPPIQCAKGTYAAASSCAVTLAATGAGHLLVATIGLNAVATTDVTGVADNGSPVNTYVHDTSADATGTLKANEVWYVCNSNAGGTTVTFSLSTPLTGDCFVCEFYGTATSNCLDTSNQVNSGTTGNPENGAALTPTNPNDVLVVGLMPETSVTSVAAPWTGQFGTNHVASTYLISTSLTTQTPSFSGDTHAASNYCSSGASFFPSPVNCQSPYCGVLGK